MSGGWNSCVAGGGGGGGRLSRPPSGGRVGVEPGGGAGGGLAGRRWGVPAREEFSLSEKNEVLFERVYTMHQLVHNVRYIYRIGLVATILRIGMTKK